VLGPGHVRLAVDSRVRVVACIPQGQLPTESARAMLPASVPHADAAFTAARAALLVEALTRRPELLLEATQDRLHQSQRAPAMPQTTAMIAALRARGAPAVVSGAGPSVLVLCSSPEQAEEVANGVTGSMGGHWTALTPGVDTTGARFVPPSA
jgi:homoserine kinase